MPRAWAERERLLPQQTRSTDSRVSTCPQLARTRVVCGQQLPTTPNGITAGQPTDSPIVNACRHAEQSSSSTTTSSAGGLLTCGDAPDTPADLRLLRSVVADVSRLCSTSCAPSVPRGLTRGSVNGDWCGGERSPPPRGPSHWEGRGHPTPAEVLTRTRRVTLCGLRGLTVSRAVRGGCPEFRGTSVAAIATLTCSGTSSSVASVASA